MKKNHEMDMCHGPIFTKLMIFALPIILTVVLQQLFNTADLVVVGRFGKPGALASVGATNSVTNLLVNLFNGMSIGAGVCIARYYGAKNQKDAQECTHTCVAAGFIFGIVLAIIAICLARPLLKLMATPDDILDNAVLYMSIYFSGMPFILLFNFCAAMLRAVGDSKRCLIIISLAGVLNVILNLVFVIFFNLNVAGVALATIISQAFAAFMAIRLLVKSDGFLRLDLKKLKINPQQLKSVALIGIPTGIQGSLFSISNMTIQSAINSFGTSVVQGTTAAANIEGYIFLFMNSISNAATNFAGQNFGANKFDRIRKTLFVCVAMTSISGIVLAFVANIFSHALIGLYTDVPAEIEIGIQRLLYVSGLYFVCGIMDVFSAMLKGLCKPVSSMLISLAGVCFLRIVWVATIFKHFKTLESLYISYPVSWALTAIVLAIEFFIVLRGYEKKYKKTV